MPLTIEEYNAIASKLGTTITTSQKGITDNQEVIHAIVVSKDYATDKNLMDLGSRKYADRVEAFETIEEHLRATVKPFLETLKPAPAPTPPPPSRITRYRRKPRE